MKLRLAAGVAVFAILVAAASSSSAATRGRYTCSGGTIPAGVYGDLLVTGNCAFAPGEVVVNGNLAVAPGAVLDDHAAVPASVHVTGNVTVGAGGVVGLGTYAPAKTHSVAVIDGNVIGVGAASLYLSRVTIHGNLVINGGGDADRNLPIKDDTIDGNVILHGWRGAWFGIIRDDIGGNVIVHDNAAADPSTLPGSDSGEIVTNTIRGNLICSGNTPAPQPGDSGGAPNTVGGHELGQCAGL